MLFFGKRPDVRDRRVIIRKADVGEIFDLLPLKAAEIRIQEGRVISLALSGRKLKKITESPSFTVAPAGRPFSFTTRSAQ